MHHEVKRAHRPSNAFKPRGAPPKSRSYRSQNGVLVVRFGDRHILPCELRNGRVVAAQCNWAFEFDIVGLKT